MRLGMLGGGRPQFFDRNTAVKQQTFQGIGLAPHSGTSRYTYTVPSLKKAQVTLMTLQVHRATVATTAGEVRAELEYTPSAGVTAELVSHRVTDNTLAVWRTFVVGASIIGFAGDIIDLITADASTGGTNTYNSTTTIDEFDA
jgi:hypothetical protein